jgi:uncharacterized membrane protein YdbT with pleckstrin-like domain
VVAGRHVRQRVDDPRIQSVLLANEGEFIVDAVYRHWAAYIRAALEAAAGLLVFVIFLFSSVSIGWLWLLVFAGLMLHSTYLGMSEHIDTFVITNMRVFRVSGVISRRRATMPIDRILDITVDKTLPGRLLGYGHFVFESAAQDQGLKEIRYVGRPDERDLTIQRVVQRSGRRRWMQPSHDGS